MDRVETSQARWRLGVILALAVTLGLGLWMRWALAGQVSLLAPMAHLRHAHSHVGYFGVLFPLAWLGWRAAGARVPGPAWMAVYAGATAVAVVGFVQGGYGPVAIAGSTTVAVVWLVSAWPLVRRLRTLHDPLAVVPLGLVASLACVPPIAYWLRRDPALAQGLVATFLGGLLLLVVVPSAIAARRISVGPWPMLLLTGAAGALFLGVWPDAVARVGLFAYAGLLVAVVASPRLALHTRAVWGAVVIGLMAVAVGLLPNTRPVALGAIHFLVLGPVLATTSEDWLRRSPPPWAWWLGHTAWGTMSLALVAQGLGGGAWTWTVAALGGTGTVFWWVATLARQA